MCKTFKHLKILAVINLGLVFCSCDIYLLLYPKSSIILKNETTTRIIEWYLRPKGSNEWGPNVLDTPVAASEETLKSSLQKSVYDTKVVFEDSTTKYIWDVDLTIKENFEIVFYL
jgi:hypothetical protein